MQIGPTSIAVWELVLADDANLAPWNEMAGEFQGAGILVGNGGSRAVSKGFAYGSLYERARGDIEHPLTDQDVALFGEMGTTNFEAVLSSLRTTEIVSTALEMDTDVVRAHYNSVRVALMEAVKSVHPPWEETPQSTLLAIREELRRYAWVYTTNYDLLLYWAVMAPGHAHGFRDFFWGECEFDGPFVCFHTDDTDAAAGMTRILYLHGALHLYELPWDETAKLISADANLLDSFGVPDEDEEFPTVPLVITEGEWQDKAAAIRRSDYLSFAFDRLGNHEGPLVVFGHSLGEQDSHIANAIGRWSDDVPIAVSIQPSDEADVVDRKLQLRRSLRGADVRFFNSLSHPLGSTELRIGG